jgi:hypothetical protein
VTGSFVRANGVFNLHFDKECQGFGWGRCIDLLDCDHPRIEGRYFSNVINIYTDARVGGTLGNKGWYAPSFLGPPKTGSEDHYNIVLGANEEALMPCSIEASPTVGSKGMIYFKGRNTDAWGIKFSNPTGPGAGNKIIFKLGADAQDCRLHSPVGLSNVGGYTLDIESPAGWEWRGAGANIDYQLTIIDPNNFFGGPGQVGFGADLRHPRIKLIGDTYNKEEFVNINGIIGDNGAALKSILMTPYTLDRARVPGGMDFINDVIADSDGYDGYAIELPVGNITNAGILLEAKVGHEIKIGDVINIAIRYKFQSAVGVGQLFYAVQNSQVGKASGAVGTSTSYATIRKSYTVIGGDFAVGDLFQMGVFTTADEKCNIASFSINTVRANIPAGSETFTGGDTVDKAEIVTLMNRVNTIIASLEEAGINSV